MLPIALSTRVLFAASTSAGISGMLIVGLLFAVAVSVAVFLFFRQRNLKREIQATKQQAARLRDNAKDLEKQIDSVRVINASLQKSANDATAKNTEQGKRIDDAANLAAEHERKMNDLEAKLAQLERDAAATLRTYQESLGAVTVKNEQVVTLLEQCQRDYDALMQQYTALKIAYLTLTQLNDAAPNQNFATIKQLVETTIKNQLKNINELVLQAIRALTQPPVAERQNVFVMN